jgi:hypothetical protein
MKILVDALAVLPKVATTVYRGVRGISLVTILQGKGVGDELVWWAPTSATGTADVLLGRSAGSCFFRDRCRRRRTNRVCD